MGKNHKKVTRKDKEESFVALEHNGKKVLMPRLEYERRIQELATNPHLEFDKYHGSSAAMYDPEAPFPQTFSPRVHPRGMQTSGASSGDVVTRDNVFGLERKGGAKKSLLAMYD